MDLSEARPERTIVEGQHLPGVEIVPTVLDTAMLLDDVRAELRRGHPTALIEAARVGSLRLFAADHVFDEVERKLDPTRDDYTLRVGVDAAAMRAVWRRSYLPTIRFVEIDLALVSDPRITRLSAEDVSDAPTAALVVLLGRCLSLSSDLDLIRHGFAKSEWLRVALLGRDVARSEEMIVSFQVGGGAIVVGSAIGLGALLRTDWGKLLVAVGGGVALLESYRRGNLTREKARRVTRRALQALEPIGRELLAQAEQRQYGRQELALLTVASSSPDLVATLVRTLALQPSPATATEIASQLKPVGFAISPSELLETLRGHGIFHQPWQHRWQVGRHLSPDRVPLPPS
jgi:hypothetical protein